MSQEQAEPVTAVLYLAKIQQCQASVNGQLS
jgi:hypothetical protein